MRQARCSVCAHLITEVVEDHFTGWEDESGDTLAYAPYLHDHTPDRAPTQADDATRATREARCGCGKIRPSSDDLPFYEYRGEGSKYAVDSCATCAYVAAVHQPVNPHTDRPGVIDHPFTPRGPHDYDSYYCGCRGWD